MGPGARVVGRCGPTNMEPRRVVIYSTGTKPSPPPVKDLVERGIFYPFIASRQVRSVINYSPSSTCVQTKINKQTLFYEFRNRC